MARSVRLLRAFGEEQSDPEHFYTVLGDDSVEQLGRWTSLEGARVLDVGGGKGYFAPSFARAGAHYVLLDPDASELDAAYAPDALAGRVGGDGQRLPFADDSVDVAYSSNALEHVPDPWRMADEMVRVTRPGGIVYLSYTLWWGPWGGHETSPWHYLGGRYAADRYARKHGRRPKNDFGSQMFALTAAAGLRWARRCDALDVVATIPRYHPWWAQWTLHVPVLREVTSWNLLIVGRKR
ncbi:UNVERIFIED_CONTAM: SAM-dependent methyltransferase [Mumia flava]